MKALILNRAGWLIVGLTVLLPLSPAAAELQPPPSQMEKLEWLLATHDVRYAIQVPHAKSTPCMRGEAERGR
jgi:hypothetical protein